MNGQELANREETPGKLPKEARALQKAAQDDDMTSPQESIEDQQWGAVRNLSQVYYQQVRESVNDLKEEINDGDIENHEQLEDRLHDYVDQHRQVFMTGLARVTLLASDNAEAYEEVGAEGAPSVEAKAYFAFMADIRDYLDAEYSDYGGVYNYFESKGEDEAVEAEPEMDEDMFGRGEPEEEGNPY